MKNGALRKVLVVDDNYLNRAILRNILSCDYEILEAVNGKEALDMLNSFTGEIAAVLLDIVMPVMDGYEVLRQMRESETLSQIPVIVTTGDSESGTEMKALTLGANDFAVKPYNPGVIKRRLWNIINLRKQAAIVNATKTDALTGLYSRSAFFETASEMLSEHGSDYYIMACFDINNFKVINDQYGNTKGDEVLKNIARIFRDGFESIGGICSRIMADNFAVLYPSAHINDEKLKAIREDAAMLDGSLLPITFSIGRYIVTDTSLSPSAMYDRAAIAAASVKGRFDIHLAYYDKSMRRRLLREQEITSAMNEALRQNQFEVWLQPQYNHSTGALIGAEALVRWRRPGERLVSPGEFIPVFERNGFIYELDKYVWAKSCELLRKWLDEGRNPLPVSVNISRYDIFKDGLVKYISDTVKKYDLPVELLRLEITESAFAKSTEQIITVVKELVDLGFTIEIDDFGSGYSSLNTLKDVPADILKLDMRFLEGEDNTSRGGSILESIVRMANWLDMTVIAEGVETTQQADYLKSIGCNYVQGYLYARPMPASEYEKLASENAKEAKMARLEKLETLDNEAFWSPSSIETLIFNSYVGGASVFEYCDGDIEILRINDKYAAIMGSGLTVDEAIKINWFHYMDEESAGRILAVIKNAIQTGAEVTDEMRLIGLREKDKAVYLRSNMRIIARTGGRYLFYCMIEDITAQREAEHKLRSMSSQMKSIMDNVGSGITAAAVGDGSISLIFANDKYYEMHGYTKQQYEAEAVDINDLILQRDKKALFSAVSSALRSKLPVSVEYRVKRRDSKIVWIRAILSNAVFEGVPGQVQLGILRDITDNKVADEKLRKSEAHLRFLNKTVNGLMNDTPGGFSRLKVFPDGSLSTVYVNDGFCRLLGINREEYLKHAGSNSLSYVHPDDTDVVREGIRRILKTNETHRIKYRLRNSNGEYIWFSVSGRVNTSDNGETFIKVYYADTTEREKSELSFREMVPVVLAAMMKSSDDLSFVKDVNLRYLCCSHSFAQKAGIRHESEIIGPTDYDIVDREMADKYTAIDRQILESGQPMYNYIEKIPSEDGSIRYANTSKYILYDSTGKAIGIYGVGRDITEERSAYERLKLLTDSIPGGIVTYLCTVSGGIKVTYFNDGFCRLIGCSREEYTDISKISATSMVLEEDIPLIEHNLHHLIETHSQIDCTYRIRPIHGEGIKWVNLRAIASERHGDNITVNAVLYDVTERIETEEELRINSEEIRIALSKMGKTVFLYDIQKKTLFVSDEYAALHGLSTVIENIPDGFAASGLIKESDLPSFTDFYEKLSLGTAHCSAKAEIADKNGCFIKERAEGMTVFDRNGKPVRAVISIENV